MPKYTSSIMNYSRKWVVTLTWPYFCICAYLLSQKQIGRYLRLDKFKLIVYVLIPTLIEGRTIIDTNLIII